MHTTACTYIIFGATGNLARLKLIPGFYHLELKNKLPANTRILAIGRRAWDKQTWLDDVASLLSQQYSEDFDAPSSGASANGWIIIKAISSNPNAIKRWRES